MSRGPVAFLRGKYNNFFVALGVEDDYESERFRLFDASPAGFAMRVVNVILVAMFFLLMIYGYITADPEMGLYIPWIFILPVAVVVKIIREVLDYWSWRDSLIPEVRKVNYDETAKVVIDSIDRNYQGMYEYIVDAPLRVEDNLNDEIHVEKDESDKGEGISLSDELDSDQDGRSSEKLADDPFAVEPLPDVTASKPSNQKGM